MTETKVKEKAYYMYGCKCWDCGLRNHLAEKDTKVKSTLQRRDDILEYEEEWVKSASYSERRQMCKNQIRHCANNNTARSSWIYKWHIGSDSDGKGTVDCCKHAFAKFYGVSIFTVDTLITELKRGQRQCAGRINQKNCEQFVDIIAEMRRDAKQVGFELTNDMLASACLPDTPAAKDCYAWLKAYIQLVGDPQPNRKGEIHLDDAASKKDIHNEYTAVKSEEMSTFTPLKYNAFLEIWDNCFPHVKIRKHKAVESKCITCANLTFLRTQAKTNAERAEITRLMTWHRVTFMGERRAYYERRHNAW
jgi:hypothetical protein